MDIDEKEVGFKVKMYLTKSTLDVEGIKPHKETAFNTLGDRTIPQYFAEVILVKIKEGIDKNCDLEKMNSFYENVAKSAYNAEIKKTKPRKSSPVKKTQRRQINNSKLETKTVVRRQKP